jgi:PQQ-dependent dehydrogenase (methanol/ethanol family)
MDKLIYLVPVMGLIGLLYTFIKFKWVSKQDAGNDRMKEISTYIAEGAMAFLKAEWKILGYFVVIVGILLATLALLLSGAGITEQKLRTAQSDAATWLTYGKNYAGWRYSTLAQISTMNVSRLAPAWVLPAGEGGNETTPLVYGGVMYITGAWSKVFALDAKSGAPLWTYDPKVPGQVGVNACCDTVNRGVAAWKGRVYLGTLDGRLIALDAATGKPVWQVATVPGGARYTITGAPRVVKGMVLIGNGGAEMGMRGYVSAYDADTGRQIWRFYTVPGDPSKPFESPALEKAARTWSGEWWTLGGGGPVWDSMAYDPGLDLIYIGVGNGTPWNRSKVQGDSLYLTSIVALKAATGEYVWHYQTTPGDEWDYDACSPLIRSCAFPRLQSGLPVLQWPPIGRH